MPRTDSRRARRAAFKKSSLAWIIGGFGLLGLCGYLLPYAWLDTRSHQQYEERLKQAREFEARLDREVLQTRLGLLIDYDPLVAATRERNRLVRELARFPAFAAPERQKLEEWRAAIARNAAEKDKLVEIYKMQHAVLRNSLAYFPKLIDESNARLNASAGGNQTVLLLNRLLQDALIFNLTTTSEMGEMLAADVGQLEALAQKEAPGAQDELAQIVAHARVILERKPIVDATLRQMTALPILPAYAVLQAGYDEISATALQRAETYRLTVYISSLALLALVFSLVVRKFLADERELRASKDRVDDALEATRAAEAKYRSIFEKAGEGIFQTSADGRYLSANPALSRIYGYASPEELEKAVTSIGSQIYVDPSRRQLFIELLEKNDEIYDFTSAIHRKDGAIAWISETAHAVRDTAGELLYYEGLVSDITERRLAMLAEQERHERELLRQRALLNLSQLDKRELAAALQEVLSATLRTLGTDRASAWRIHRHPENGARLEFLDGAGHHGEPPTAVQLGLASRYLTALESKPCLPCPSALEDEHIREWPREALLGAGQCAALDIPIWVQGALHATLRLEHAKHPRAWAVDDVDFAVAAASQIALCFETADRLRAEAEADRQRDRAEELLLNILPGTIAERLKSGSGLIADHFGEATVLFADIVNFTEFSADRPPRELVSFLNRVFSAFDQLANEFGLEKIKTIGDAYMVVGGVPSPRADHTEAVLRMGIAMLERCEQLNRTEETPFAMRIGINCGPVVAGVIGIQKFIYDLWGDTVNLASRMESQGLTGKIQVTEAVYETLKDRYIFTPRGRIEIKGRGLQPAYLLVTNGTPEAFATTEPNPLL